MSKGNKRSKKSRFMRFLLSYEHLRLDLDRVHINMLEQGKWLILVYLFQVMSEIVNSFFLNLYII